MSADNMILLACAAERRAAVAPGPAAAAVDRYFLPTGPTVANPPQRHATAKWLYIEQTDGQTPYHYYASSVNNSLQQMAAYT